MAESVSPHARRYASMKEAAAYVQVSDRHIRHLVSTGKLTGYRLGARAVRVDLAELDALMEPIATAKRRP